MTVQFITGMLKPEVNVIVRQPCFKTKDGKQCYMVCEDNTAGEMATGTDKFYQSVVTDFEFRGNQFVITIDETAG